MNNISSTAVQTFMSKTVQKQKHKCEKIEKIKALQIIIIIVIGSAFSCDFGNFYNFL